MTTLEQRLRAQLPELADAIVAGGVAGGRTPAADVDGHSPALADVDAEIDVEMDVEMDVDIDGDVDAAFAPDPSPLRRWRPRIALAAAAATLLATIASLVIADRWGDDDPAPATVPTSFGSWHPIADAPILSRPYAVSGWTGSEALFWAGSSLSRGFAFTDGALYDPATDTWRLLPVPGWGHPGLTGVFLDGQLYALAKGGGTRLDTATGEWIDLPHVEDMFLAATVATDDAVWGLGPAADNPVGQPDLAIARYDAETDSWSYGPTFEGTTATAELVNSFDTLDTDVVWSGTEIVVWNGGTGGVAFDPATQTWRTIGVPPVPGVVRSSHLTVTGAGLTLVVEIDRDTPVLGMAVDAGDGWRWYETQIPVTNPETLTIASAGDWVVLFSDVDAPVTIDAATGWWQRHDDAPVAGVAGPNAVWTGEELVVWGGVATPTAANPDPAAGARWTPPPSD